jgi:hypothetical protein
VPSLPSCPLSSRPSYLLAVNLKTARALGLKIPKSILLRADELVERAARAPTRGNQE